MIRIRKKAHNRGTRLILSALLSLHRRGSEDAHTTSFITSSTSSKRVPTSNRDPLKVGVPNIETIKLVLSDAIGSSPYFYLASDTCISII
jgi:hypothetical protein